MKEESDKSKRRKEWLAKIGRGELNARDFPPKKPDKEDIISKLLNKKDK